MYKLVCKRHRDSRTVNSMCFQIFLLFSALEWWGLLHHVSEIPAPAVLDFRVFCPFSTFWHICISVISISWGWDPCLHMYYTNVLYMLKFSFLGVFSVLAL